MCEIISPNEFAKNEGLFTLMTTWSPKTGLLHYIIHKSISSLFEATAIITGFQHKTNRFLSPYHNFGGSLLRIVMPGIVIVFAKSWNYPDGSKIRTGIDVSAAHYISKALNFRFE